MESKPNKQKHRRKNRNKYEWRVKDGSLEIKKKNSHGLKLLHKVAPSEYEKISSCEIIDQALENFLPEALRSIVAAYFEDEAAKILSKLLPIVIHSIVASYLQDTPHYVSTLLGSAQAKAYYNKHLDKLDHLVFSNENEWLMGLSESEKQLKLEKFLPGETLLHDLATNFFWMMQDIKQKRINVRLGDAAQHGKMWLLKLVFKEMETLGGKIPAVFINQAFRRASKCGHAEIVRTLLDIPELNVEDVDVYGKTALQLAAMHGHADVVSVLLTAVDANSTGHMESEMTALMCASDAGHREVVKLLLANAETEVNCVNKEGWTALTFASNRDHTEIVKMLLDTAKIKKAQINEVFSKITVKKPIAELLKSYQGINKKSTRGLHSSSAMISTIGTPPKGAEKKIRRKAETTSEKSPSYRSNPL